MQELQPDLSTKHVNVRDLRLKGYQVHIHHEHTPGVYIGPLSGKKLPFQATTLAILKDPQRDVETWAKARCSTKDNFSRQRGIQIALGRAVKKMKEVYASGN
jgi:hypothetical protein